MDVKSRHAQLSDALHAQLSIYAGDTTVWLALDGAVRPIGYHRSDSEHRVEAQLNGPGAMKLTLAHEQIDRQWFPTWVPLDLERAADSFFLQDSIELALGELEPDRLNEGHGRRVAGWLEVQGHARLAATQFAARMLQRTPARTSVLLRLHDPAVLWAIWPLLLQEQQASWFGAIKSWRLLDPAGNLVLLQPSPATPADAPLTTDQWLDIANITPMNHTLRACLQRLGRTTSGALEQVRIDVVAALRRARHLGFTDAMDLALFAEHAVLVSPEFDLHDRVRRELDRREPGDHYSELIESLTDEDWAAVKEQVSHGGAFK